MRFWWQDAPSVEFKLDPGFKEFLHENGVKVENEKKASAELLVTQALYLKIMELSK